jgi:pilus assembly protein CpaB
MICFAVVFGLLAVFVAQSWLSRQAALQMKNAPTEVSKPLSTRTVVVANSPLRFGQQLSSQSLREVPWPESAVPKGTFASINQLLAGGKRIVLSSIEANEPILAAKITGAGQKATLSAVLQEGMKAVTVRVSDVEGVAGFVLPGDHVDVLLTRQSDRTAGTTDVVLQNAKVLAVDQLADDSTEKPTVVKAVTLEVDTVAAQKLSLASSVGNLSLVLRKAGELYVEGTRRIALTDLANGEASTRGSEVKRFATISVTRASKKKEEFSVPSEDADARDLVGSGSRDDDH